MGDRFYGQQQGKLGYKKGTKPVQPRRLKKDIVTDIEVALNAEFPSMEKMTVKDLNALLEVIHEVSE